MKFAALSEALGLTTATSEGLTLSSKRVPVGVSLDQATPEGTRENHESGDSVTTSYLMARDVSIDSDGDGRDSRSAIRNLPTLARTYICNSLEER